ncbi:MAG: 16S rRNA (cytosine(1402)-N(4))-methyltransferase RsmH [Alphaproteobacteria bacterium]|nr:16S rRNA (cytosine(1402)-N(4))-methyltransferase RsmH [Alphaproteobacteria bacterium]
MREPAAPQLPSGDKAHVPVLLAETIAALAVREDGRYLDGTFGAGGYTRAILDAADCKVVALDRDPDAIARGQAMKKRYGDRLALVEGRFGELDRVAREAGFAPLDGVALDLGVSSPQIDTPERGFSFRFDGPLDMRMERQGASAADIVNTWGEKELADAIFDLGEERHSRRVARAILAARAQKKIERTAELAQIVRSAVPRSKDGIDPATRTFQALRIATNDELGELSRALSAAERALAPGGRLAVVSFHSLEDRTVKRFLKSRAGDVDRGSRHMPARAAAAAPSFRLVQRKGIRPSAAEADANPRARSATLRVAERTAAPAWAAGEAA